MNIITTEEQLAEFVEYYSTVPAFAYDVETIGEDRLYPVINDVCWISFATEGRSDVIPMGHPNGEFEHWNKPLLLEGQRRVAAGKPITDAHFSKDQRKWTPIFSEPPEQLMPAQVFKALRPLMFSKKLKIGHNLSFDLESVAKYFGGKIPSGPYFDTMMAAFIANNLNKNRLNMADTAKRELGIHVEKGIGANVAEHSFSDVARYAGIDAEITWKLYKALAPQLEGDLARVWRLERDVLPAIAEMELAGAMIDTEQLEIIAEQISKDKELAEAKAYRIAGKAFSINSVKVKQELLFASVDGKKPRVRPNPKIAVSLTPKGKEAAMQGQELTPYDFSVSAEALEFYRGRDELVDALLEYQDLNKLLTTYVTPYTGGTVKRVTNGKETFTERKSLLINGKVHTNFKAHGTDTGRFSSSGPNLQNIPSSGEYGKLIRNLFIAPKGHKLVVADYSQIEPRIMAALSRDPLLMNNYLTGGDIYTTIGDAMGVNRKAGKVLVLAISYGVGPAKIATEIGCTVQEAKQLLNDFETQFPDISKFKSTVIRAAKQHSPIPYVETIFGRRRYLPDLLSDDPGLLRRAERQAFNAVIQGSAADIMKLAIVRAHSCFVDEPDIKLLLTVHDELVTSCPEDRAEEVAEAIRMSMEGVSLKQITVPLIAEVYTVDKWGEAK